MSFYVPVTQFLRWLERSSKAVITKNNVRKELWEQLGDITTLTSNPNYYPIPTRYYASLMSFFNIEGKSDNITNDQLYNIINVLLTLIRMVREYQVDAQSALTRPASPVTQLETKYDTVETKPIIFHGAVEQEEEVVKPVAAKPSVSQDVESAGVSRVLSE
jgi:hypothetical protein